MTGEVLDFRKCVVCGKKCEEFERNTDDTYAHAECLRQHMLRLIAKERHD